MRIILGQQNFLVGDTHGNAKKILSTVTHARDHLQCNLIVFPELTLTGYPPEDLLFRPDFNNEVASVLENLVTQIHGIDVILGLPQKINDKIYNAAVVLRDKKILATYHKQCLPNYAVFDEKRYFAPGSTPCVFESHGIKIGVIICEDGWFQEPAKQSVAAGAELLISINASPFDIGKSRLRENVIGERVAENNVPIIYVHQVGAQDDFVFDGGSFVMDANKDLLAHADFFKEQLLSVEVETSPTLKVVAQPLPIPMTIIGKAYHALVLGTREYIEKNKFPGALVGISGGIDSALTLAIAVDAIGKDRVHAVFMPSRYSSPLSATLAKQQAEMLGVQYSVIPIEPLFTRFVDLLKDEFSEPAKNSTEENIQARIRAVILMALSNHSGKILLNTSNKSEIAVGYGTLYGDMAGGFAVLKDVFKTFIYKLVDYRNSRTPVILQEIIDRVPTAELAPNQTDEATLLPYPLLDDILERYVEKNQSAEEITASGIDAASVQRIIRLIIRNEYKRRQAPPGIKITPRAFGRDWRFPITSGFKP